jgi:hypothetical protein
VPENGEHGVRAGHCRELVDHAGARARTWYWIDPETGEQVKILPSHPIHSIPTTTPDRFMRIGQDDQG